MKDYTPEVPATFCDTIQIPETSDPAHADIINTPTKQIHQNTMVNQLLIAGMFGFRYDEEFRLIANPLSCHVEGDLILIPKMLAEYDPETRLLKLKDGTGIVPYTPGSGGGAYVLPPATRERLGGVKVGNGIDVEMDGTISVNVETTAEAAADIVEKNAEEYSDDQIDELFEEEPEGETQPTVKE